MKNPEHKNSDIPDHQEVDAVQPDRSTFPPGYRYNPDLLEDADEQLLYAWQDYDYQNTPPPNFDHVPALDVSPSFNPTNAPLADLLKENWCPDSLKRTGWDVHGAHTQSGERVKIWRFVDRSSLQDGTGITSSTIIEGKPFEDHPDMFRHMASTQASRTGDRATPFVSFTTDPEYAASLFKAKDFGQRGGRDSVVIQATVTPGRILSHGRKKEGEVLLIGGLGADEYDKAMEIDDFIEAATAESEQDEEIGSRLAEVEILATNTDNIGSLKIDTIEDMSVVPMGDQVGIEADFRNIPALDRATSKNLELFKQEVISSPRYERLRDKLSRLDAEQQELELQLLFATGLAATYFGEFDNASDEAAKKLQRDRTYLDHPKDHYQDGKAYGVKSLSMVGSEALCTEYSIFVKEALHRLGTDYSYIAAEKQVWSDEPSFYHSFLISPDGKTVLDPLETAQYYSKNLAYGVYTLQEPLHNSRQPVEARDALTGQVRHYSLRRIE